MLTRTGNLWQLGTLLVGLGALFLLGNLGLFDNVSRWFWVVVFFGSGAALLGLFYLRREHWWALIPGFGLLALGAAALDTNLSGSLFLGLIGAGFGAVYLTETRRWWALIPAGALLTLALVAGLDATPLALDTGPIFFLGLALTFALVYLISRQSWAIYPAAGTLLVAALASNVFSGLWNALGPLLIVGGAYLLYRRQSSNKPSNKEA